MKVSKTLGYENDVKEKTTKHKTGVFSSINSSPLILSWGSGTGPQYIQGAPQYMGVSIKGIFEIVGSHTIVVV